MYVWIRILFFAFFDYNCFTGFIYILIECANAVVHTHTNKISLSIPKGKQIILSRGLCPLTFNSFYWSLLKSKK